MATTRWNTNLISQAKQYAQVEERKRLARKYINATLIDTVADESVPILVISRTREESNLHVAENRKYTYKFYEYDDYINNNDAIIKTHPDASHPTKFISWPEKEAPTSFSRLKEVTQTNLARTAQFRAILGTTSTPVPRYAIVRPLMLSTLSPSFDYNRKSNMNVTDFGEIITKFIMGNPDDPDLRRVDPLLHMQMVRVVPEFGQLQAQRFLELLELNGPKIDRMDLAPQLATMDRNSDEYKKVMKQIDELERFASEDDDRLDQVKTETVDYALRGNMFYEQAQHAYFPKLRVKMQKFWRDHMEMFQYWALHIPCHALVHPWKYKTHKCHGRHLEHFANGYKLSFPQTDEKSRVWGKRMETMTKLSTIILRYSGVITAAAATAATGGAAIVASEAIREAISAEIVDDVSGVDFTGRGVNNSWSDMLDAAEDFWDNDAEIADFNEYAKDHNGEGHLHYLWYKLKKIKPIPKGPQYNTFKQLLTNKRFKDVWDNGQCFPFVFRITFM
jgi:hypothetical protein